MPKDWYPSVNEISHLDWHDLWSKALKAQENNKSPHAVVKVDVEVDKLLRLLEMTRSMVR